MLGHEFLKPRVSWLNPRFTIAVPATVTAEVQLPGGRRETCTGVGAWTVELPAAGNAEG